MTDFVAVMILLAVEFAAAVLSYIYWVRHYGQFSQAKLQLEKSLQSHRERGTMEQHMENIATGKVSLCRERKPLRIYLAVFMAMVLGVLTTVLLIRGMGLGLTARLIVGSVSILPFVCLLAVAVAQESDENKIIDLTGTITRQVALRVQDGSGAL
jgi:hypothetical protein